MEISFNTPALLFPAISLLLLAYTNRFLALANLVRKLHDEYTAGQKNKVILRQIHSLRRRINLIRYMQGLGVFSFLSCVACMYCIFKGWDDVTGYIFAVSLLSLLASLIFSLVEIIQSTNAIELELSDMEELEKSNIFTDLLAGRNEKKRTVDLQLMKRLIYFIIFPLMAAAIAASCSKDGNIIPDEGTGVHVYTPSDTTAPELDIYTPAALQSYSNGTSISITGKTSDDYGLYRGSIRITDGNGALVKEQQYEIHGLKSYNFSLNHTVFCLAATDYTISVSFEDHGTNVIMKTVKVKATP